MVRHSHDLDSGEEALVALGELGDLVALGDLAALGDLVDQNSHGILL